MAVPEISLIYNKFLCFTLLLCCVCVNNFSGCYGLDSGKKYLFVFGDSLFDAGNNQYMANSTRMATSYYPYGMNFHNRSTGRVSDGLIVPDLIAKYANLEFVPPYLQPGAKFPNGACFASAGSGVLENHPGVMNLKTQLSNFKTLVGDYKAKLGDEETQNMLKRSVFLASMGGNDYFMYDMMNPNATVDQLLQYQRMVIGNITNGLKEVYALGGRKFAFQNVGPLGCTPTIRAFHPELKGGCAKEFLLHAQLHNKALANALEKLSRKLPGFKYSVFDYYHALGDKINHPAKHGFKEGQTACCGTGNYNAMGCGGGDSGTTAYKLCKNASEYVFFDGGHTTQHANEQLAELIWSGGLNVTAPYNVKQLFELD